ncbi:MAG TPA: hypothetical protein VFH21_06055, partial [Burkholderiales bacterium]|nr:hypothetical protein [Burkholderiales bacterium]
MEQPLKILGYALVLAAMLLASPALADENDDRRAGLFERFSENDDHRAALFERFDANADDRLS